MTPKAKSVRSDQSSERRNQILAIAAALFASHGYAATTVRDIADEAGILSGSLYHHFSSKEEIFQEILRGFLDALLEESESIQNAGRDARETLDLLIETAFNMIEAQPEAVTLYQNEFSYVQSEPGFEFLLEKSKQIELIWRRQIEVGQQTGVFHDSSDAALVYRFIRDAVWGSVRWFRPGDPHTTATLTRNFLDLLHQGILAE